MALAPATSIGAGQPLGLTGATDPTRYVGGTVSGAPVSGTFALGDFIIDETGKLYVCTVAGSPGTWTQAGGGGANKLFDQTLGADTASIDTGAGGISTSLDLLEVFMYLRTTQAVTSSSVTVRANNDSGSNYDLHRLQGVNATVSASPGLGTAQWTFDCPGASATASYFTVIRATFPSYAQTTGFKVGEVTQAMLTQVAASTFTEVMALTYRSTTAISRLAVTAGSGNLLTGSRLLIYGR